jgi:hypothetical protein
VCRILWLGLTVARERYYVLHKKIVSPNTLAKKSQFEFKILLVFFKNWNVTLVLRKKAFFPRRNLGKISENCDDNIEPRARRNGHTYILALST